MGHILQNRDALLRNVRAEGPISDRVLLESIQGINCLSCFAELSMLRVEVAPQDMHCHRLAPDAVLP